MDKNSLSFIPPSLHHFSHTCPGLHGPGAKTRVERYSFEDLFQNHGPKHIIIPLFQRAYCWNTSTTVPAWWRDTTNINNNKSNITSHSCGKIIFKQHDDAWWCLDGQQRITSTMLLLCSARDSLLFLQKNYPHLSSPSSSSSSSTTLQDFISLLNSVLYVDVPSAISFASKFISALSHYLIDEGQRLPFSRLIPSYCDRQHYFEIILSGLILHNNRNVKDNNWMSATTQQSAQYDTKHYFDEQFQQILNNNTPKSALSNIIQRATSALSTQLMMIDVQSPQVNMYQIYEWLQESSLLSMGALLFNPTPGMKMHACDLSRNLFMSPFTNDSLVDQEHRHFESWVQPIEIKCGGNLEKMDRVLQELVSRHLTKNQQSETEKRIITTIQSQATMMQQDLSGLVLYARVVSLFEFLENNLTQSVSDEVARKQQVALTIMQITSQLCGEIYAS